MKLLVPCLAIHKCIRNCRYFSRKQTILLKHIIFIISYQPKPHKPPALPPTVFVIRFELLSKESVVCGLQTPPLVSECSLVLGCHLSVPRPRSPLAHGRGIFPGCLHHVTCSQFRLSFVSPCSIFDHFLFLLHGEARQPFPCLA